MPGSRQSPNLVWGHPKPHSPALWLLVAPLGRSGSQSGVLLHPHFWFSATFPLLTLPLLQLLPLLLDSKLTLNWGEEGKG